MSEEEKPKQEIIKGKSTIKLQWDIEPVIRNRDIQPTADRPIHNDTTNSGKITKNINDTKFTDKSDSASSDK